MLSFRNRILRDHQRILPAYLSLSSRRVDPKDINDMEALRATCPTLHKGRTWGPVVVGFKHRGHDTTLHD